MRISLNRAPIASTSMLVAVIALLVYCTPENMPPILSNAPGSITVAEGFGSQSVDLANVFTDADLDALTLTATSSNESVVTASVSGTTLTITEVGAGTSTITLTATDGNGGSASGSFTVTVIEVANESPTVVNPLPDRNENQGFGSVQVELPPVFNDAETEMLRFQASSSATSVVTVSVTGPTLTITEVGMGTSTITVTAIDEENASVTDVFAFTVNDGGGGNQNPTVTSALADISFTEGFGSETVALADVFTDPNDDNLSYSATSSNTAVAAVSVTGSTLTLTEVGAGNTTITVTANDGNGGSAEDSFAVEIGTTQCANDNSINQEDIGCASTPNQTSEYSESVSGDVRTITANTIPDHDYSVRQGATLQAFDRSYTVDVTPQLANSPTSILNDQNRPRYYTGIGLNGIPLDPAPAEPFIFTDANTGEYNWDWVFEPTNNQTEVSLDCNIAHTGPFGYHYHGTMRGLADNLLAGLGTGNTAPTEPVQVGWAADGFPIVYKYGPNANGTITELQPSWQLKTGNRPGDGETEPCGEYNGKYTIDYEYVAGTGELDECNGIAQSITVNGETFSYFYVVTEAFPIIGRCISGTPDPSFVK